MPTENKRKANNDYESQRLINFFEELSWLLDSNKDLNFKNASKTLKLCRDSIAHDSAIGNQKRDEYNLIGVLPSLLKDTEIFQNNAQLVQFAEEVLSLSIVRWEKRSRNEIIGLIVCEVVDANKERLNLLTQWTEGILNNKKQVKTLQNKAKSSGNLFSWNETIQKIVGGLDE